MHSIILNGKLFCEISFLKPIDSILDSSVHRLHPLFGKMSISTFSEADQIVLKLAQDANK